MSFVHDRPRTPCDMSGIFTAPHKFCYELWLNDELRGECSTWVPEPGLREWIAEGLKMIHLGMSKAERDSRWMGA